MSDLTTDLLRGINNADRAATFATAMQYEFHNRAQAFDWAGVEDARRNALHALDAYFDVLLAIHKRLELAGAKPQVQRAKR